MSQESFFFLLKNFIFSSYTFNTRICNLLRKEAFVKLMETR